MKFLKKAKESPSFGYFSFGIFFLLIAVFLQSYFLSLNHPETIEQKFEMFYARKNIILLHFLKK